MNKIKFIFTDNINNLNIKYDILYSDKHLNNLNYIILKPNTSFFDFIKSEIPKIIKPNITIAVISPFNFIKDHVERNKLIYKNILIEDVIISYDDINKIASLNTSNISNIKRYKFCKN